LSSAAPDEAPHAEDTLVVPVNVVALCVGIDDAQQATSKFAGATAVYDEQYTKDHMAYLGTNVTRTFRAPPWDQLQAGVHLHWALPDGLTRGGGEGAELDFPAAPNRWLVTRIVISGGSPAIRSWLVESDALSPDKPPAGVSYVTLPVRDDPRFPRSFGYLGRSQPADAGWQPDPGSAGPPIAQLAGTPLSAVSNGEIGFAAYYPGCRGVFGFCDALDDLAPPASAPARLAYAVTGWYADPGQDPVRPGSTPEQLQQDLGWTFTPGAAAPSRSSYAGLVQGIEWSPRRSYILGQPVQQPVQARAAIGNTAAEALAAYFMADDHPGEPLFETLLEALQAGLLDDFADPRPDGLAELRQRLHAQHFAGLQAGTVFSVVAAGPGGPESGELTGLPARLAADLDALNAARQEADQYAFHADWYRWQMFADWYRIFMASNDIDRGNSVGVATQRYARWGPLDQRHAASEAAAHRALEAVTTQLPPDTQVREGVAGSFAQPASPVVVIAADAITFPDRYGGDGRFRGDGYLACRTGEQLLTSVSADGTTLTAASLAGVTAPAALPDAGLLTELLREACLLCTDLMAELSGVDVARLRDALVLALAGTPQDVYTMAGQPPSAAGVTWWAPGQWLPLFASWQVRYLPLQPTREDGRPRGYQPPVVTANFQLDADAAVRYVPSGKPGTITIDPAVNAFRELYQGSGTLTPTPARNLAAMLGEYLDAHEDATLRAVLDELTEGPELLVVPLDGLADALTMRARGVQLRIRVPGDSPYLDLTEAIADVAPDAPRGGGPDFGGHFNPLRAGYLKLDLTLVDVFGLPREVQIPELTCASSMTAAIGQEVVRSVAYLAPRIAQPGRLAFHWLPAAGPDIEEVTQSPATSPVCGWLLPSHVDGSLAIYDQEGRPLGTLFRFHDGDDIPAGWQSAPGDARTAGQDLATVMSYQNPRLRDVVTAIAASGRTFAAMWRLLDTVGETVEPGPFPTDSALAVLVGRPVALAEAALRLELHGAAMLNLGWEAIGSDSDSGLTGVEFPVILGDLDRLRDGLIGYFKELAPGAGYDMGTFYSEGADGATPGIAKPAQDTLCVTAVPPVNLDAAASPADLAAHTQRVLMLIDPRARVHATTGILPTATLELPPGLTQSVVSALSLFLFTSPVLRGASALALPVPSVDGYALSYIDQVRDAQGTPGWLVTPDIAAPGDGVWGYTPQEAREGWLRLTPVMLEFTLANPDGEPVVRPGVPNTLALTVANRSHRDVTLRAGQPVAEGIPPPGAVFYIHFGTLVDPPAVGLISLSAPGWAFQAHHSPQRGAYWAAAPVSDIGLADAARFTVAVSGLVPAPAGGVAGVSFDYRAIDGISDGGCLDVLIIRP
jgi:hypothetical protein